MGAVCGLVGEGELSAVRDMASRMTHRGAHLQVWNPGSGVYFGECRSSNEAVDGSDTLTLDESLYRLDSTEDSAASRRNGLRQILAAGRWADLRQARGYFAAAFWREETRELCLAVDQLAYKSLYYCFLDGRVAFASEYKAFFALPDFRPDIDLVAVQYHQALRIAMPWRPSLAGVKMVSSGSVTRIRGKQENLEYYWTPRVVESARPFEESARLVREQLLRTVADQVQGQDQVGIALSAGVDSAIVANCACELKGPSQVTAYSVGYAAADSELAGAGQVADLIGIKHNATYFEAEDVRKFMPQVVWLLEDCTAREETLFHLKLLQAIAGQESVILHGVGADLLFGGMPRHRLIALSMRLPLLRRPLLSLYQHSQTGMPPAGIAGNALAWAMRRGKSYLPPRISGVAGPTVIKEPQDLNHYLADSVVRMSSVHYTEPMAEQNGLNLRAPFLDPDAVALALSIPMRHKIGWRRQKLVLRAAFASHLPKGVSTRPKTIHRLRHDVILSEALDGMARDTGGLAHIRRRGLVDTKYLDALQARAPREPYATERLYRLWTLVSLEIWLRQFVDGGGTYWDFSST